MSFKLSGANINGSQSKHGRIENDYYATPYSTTEDILNALPELQECKSFLEPAVGAGHITDVLKKYYPNASILGIDIVDRMPNCPLVVADFMEINQIQNFDCVITNPPFSQAVDFVNKSLELSNRYVLMFLKIQFLEGQRRRNFWKNTSLREVHIFSKRQNPLYNGSEYNKEGKKLTSSLMCFAWYLWDKEYEGYPVIKWI